MPRKIFTPEQIIRLKRLVAEKELDLQILKEAIAFESKNF